MADPITDNAWKCETFPVQKYVDGRPPEEVKAEFVMLQATDYSGPQNVYTKVTKPVSQFRKDRNSTFNLNITVYA